MPNDNNHNMVIFAVIGTQWGDEGKGKVVDILAKRTKACARYNGGANAGHSLVVGDTKIACHLVPCGILNPDCLNIIGNGMVIDLEALAKELDHLSSKLNYDCDARLVISSRAHINFRFHRLADAHAEKVWRTAQGSNLGTTLKGIGPCYAAKCLRLGMQAADLKLPFQVLESKYRAQLKFFTRAFDLPEDFDSQAELQILQKLQLRFRPLVQDLLALYPSIQKLSVENSTTHNNNVLDARSHMIIEAANATMLDLNAGTYPYCTSSDTLTGGIAGGLCIATKDVNVVLGVAKAYCTRVGEGPFPTELSNTPIGDYLQKKGNEFGTSTGRARRCGWFDAVVVRYAHAINHLNLLVLTKLDVLSGLKELKVAINYKNKHTGDLLPNNCVPADLNMDTYECIYESYKGWDEELQDCRHWHQLPPAAQAYVQALETILNIPILYVSVGPDRDQIIYRQSATILP